MCGLAGTYSYSTQQPVSVDVLNNMNQVIYSRGPDDSGVWIDQTRSVGFAHRRLSIIDLDPRSKQPMSSEDGRYHIVYNGEIYNYQFLKQQLQNKGYHFRTTSDTEVVLMLYIDQGSEMLTKLRGMFAFAIYDSVKQGLLLARDHFGIKPLYYVDDGKILHFSSQVKALLATNVNTEPCTAGHVGYFLWGSVPEPFTLYRRIKALPAGHSVWIDAKGMHQPQPYFSLTELYQFAEQNAEYLSIEEIQSRVYAAIQDSIEHHMIADVPVGVFLSAGLDSTVITNYAAKKNPTDLNTMTLGFAEYRNEPLDEVPIAENIAKYYKTAQHTQWLTQQEAQQDFSKFIQAMDQPTIDGANSYFVSKLAADNSLKVVLSGVGGDEFLGGYPDFARIPHMVEKLHSLGGVGKFLRVLLSPFIGEKLTAKYASVLEYGNTYARAYLLSRSLLLPWQLNRVFSTEFVLQGLEQLNTLPLLQNSIDQLHNPFLKVSALTTQWYMRNQLLPDVDWSSMAHSIEVRLPFVDIEFVSTIMPLLAGMKYPTKKQLLSNVPNLPKYLLEKKKTGFNIPMAQWFGDKKLARTMRYNPMYVWAQTIYQTFKAME